MKRNWVMKSVSWCMVTLMAGCATYTPMTTGTPEASGVQVMERKQGDLTLYVEEFATKEKSKRAFDADLAKKGVLPVLVTVENKGEAPCIVKCAHIVVRDGDRVLPALTPEEASRKAKRGAVSRALGWSLIVPIISIPIAATASALHTNKVNKRITQDFMAKAFPDGDIQPHQKQSGFVFFELPKGRDNLNGLQLELTATNADTEDLVTLATPLLGARFIPTEAVYAKEEVSPEML